MDAITFDRLTRFVTSSPTRRRLGGILLGALAGVLGLAPAAAAAPCPSGQKRCKQRCIPRRHCCTTANCRPKQTGKVCRRGACVCPPSKTRCRGRCISRRACCTDADCQRPTTGRVCRGGGCRCPGGQKLCNGICISSVICCAATDCGPGQVCLSNQSCAIPATTGTCPAGCVSVGSVEGGSYCKPSSGTCNLPCASTLLCPRGTACLSCGPGGNNCQPLCTA